MMTTPEEADVNEDLKKDIREHYGAAAAAARELAHQDGGAQDPSQTPCCAPAPSASCCGLAPESTSCCTPSPSADVLDISQDLYDDAECAEVPLEARLASLGCGNPVALAQLRPGETVLDLGSGGGIDVLLSARRVGPEGKAYGLDMTDEMLAMARRNQAEAGVANVEFLKGDIEAVPLPDASVDVIISNCVVNLAPDKDRVFAEAFRVLRPGGRLAVADIVFLGDVAAVPAELRRQVEAWAACVAGALGGDEYLARLDAAGFVGARLDVLNVYDTSGGAGICGLPRIELPDGVQLASAFVSARKPGAGDPAQPG
jgi:arsenite methyltransferase